MVQKTCFGDGEDQEQHALDSAKFSSDSRRDDGLSVYCRECAAARQRRWKHENPEKVKLAKKDYRARQKIKKMRDVDAR